MPNINVTKCENVTIHVNEYSKKPLARLLTVLILDDDIIQAKLATALVEKVGAFAVYFTDPDKALATCRQVKFDAIITDQFLGNVSTIKTGFQFVDEVRKLGQNPSIMYLTAISQPSDVLLMMEKAEYCQKPPKLDTIEEFLRLASKRQIEG